MFGLFGRRAQPQELPPPQPERLTYAVGDIHGRADLLDEMLDLIEADRDGAPADLVFLGDYVDRGPDSAGVLRRLAALRPEAVRVVCLMGNHERMMLDFLDAPEQAGGRWLSNGGIETLASFATGRAEGGDGVSRLEAVRDQFRASLGPELEAWVRDRPLSYLTGTLGCVHAMADPCVPWSAQTAATLLWGRPEGRTSAREDGIWVLHGHTIVPEPTVAFGRIALDTGAYRTDALSALRCEGGAVAFIATRRRDQ